MMSRIQIPVFLLCCLLNLSVLAQTPKTLHSGEIILALKKLQVLGSALYIAAHPDDENTALLAYLANDRLMRTGYLSLTRGDGGQNLIGAEQRELLGLIRTQELLQARRLDGAEQFFTRANDFGYSKHAEETKKIWDKDKVLADMVWVIRKFRPDVIVTRFPPTRDAGHGHHEASSQMAIEAFYAAADPQKFPEQLKFVEVWQVKRVLWDSYSIRRGQFTNQPPDSLKTFTVEIGTYNPLLGKSHLVIAAESRSMHKSQGFGASKPRGGRTDNMSHLAGDTTKTNLFEGIITTWARIPNTQNIQTLLQKAYQEFSPEKPHLIVPQLLAAYQALEQYPRPDQTARYWLELKKAEIKEIIAACLGLWIEANGKTYSVSPGDSLNIQIEAVNRCPYPVTLNSITLLDAQNRSLAKLDKLPQKLSGVDMFNPELKVLLPPDIPFTQPYWLQKAPLKGIFQVDDLALIGMPENTSALKVNFEVQMDNFKLTYTRSVTYKWTKADEGELYRTLEITPQAMVNLEDDLLIFASNAPKTIKINVKAGKDNASGLLRPELGTGWKIEPAEQVFQISKKDAEMSLEFKLTPPSNFAASELKILIKSASDDSFKPAFGLHRIEYPHIPIQTLFPEAKAVLQKPDIQLTGKNIGYIQGAGDDIPRYLRQLGYQVSELGEKDMEGDLAKFDAIIAGVRAYNTQDWLKHDHEKLMEYVKNGGIYVVQYHTNFRMVVSNLGPYPLEIGRERVSVEEAPMRFVDEKHPLLNYPNKITARDFEGWVQERGLYFAQKWDEKYQPVLGCHDPGEKELLGGLLYAEYGKGRFVYTGLSFFRELPAGVIGAYRLFVNLISK